MPDALLARCEIRHSHGDKFAVCARPSRHSGLCCPNEPPCSTCVQPPALVCARCGEKPADRLSRTARLGETHLASRRRDGVVGMGAFHRVEACGPWVRAGTAPEQRQKALEDWRAVRAGEEAAP